MISILTWVSIIAGGILILLLLLSLIGGLDLDLDIGSTDIETDAGGIGLVKGFLTFISVSSWVIKILLHSNQNPAMATIIGVVCGILAFLFLNFLLRLLMRNEENVNWSPSDAMFQNGEVYLKIPAKSGSGIVNVNINGAMREMKAKSRDKLELKTGTPIVVVDIEGEYAIVSQQTN